MLDAIRAEARKFRRHRATWLMVWIYPIGIALIVLGAILYNLAIGISPSSAETAHQWIADDTTLWRLPRSGPGRLLIAGFTAMMFAGEYNWNTWKLILPARARWEIVVAKWTVAFGFMFVALIAADVLSVLSDLVPLFGGTPIPAGVTFGAVLSAHVRAAGNTVAPILYTIAFASMFAILTRSILATMILSIAMVVIEGLVPILAFIGHAKAPIPTTLLVRALPFYHMLNLNAWALGMGKILPLSPDAVVATAWSTSLVVIAVWTLVAAAIALLHFQRQDIN